MSQTMNSASWDTVKLDVDFLLVSSVQRRGDGTPGGVGDVHGLFDREAEEAAWRARFVESCAKEAGGEFETRWLVSLCRVPLPA